MRRAGERERAWLNDTFAALCAIDSPSGSERRCADHIAGELRALGVAVHEDRAGSAVGSDAGNLYAHLPGAGEHSLLLCAHMDTVPAQAPIEPRLIDGGWENSNDAILGADNKAAVAVILALARRLAQAPEAPRAGLELLFTVCEETGLRGALAFDRSRLRSSFGYVFDQASPIGEVIVAAPGYDLIDAEVRGRAAHAGLAPERGANAIAAAARAIVSMPLGRLDEETTANVGTIAGGSAANVVAERCRLLAEARGISEERLAAVVTEIIDCLQEAADAAACDLDVTVQRLFAGYRVAPGSPALAVAERALEACGYRPRRVRSGVGSDANALRAAGFECLNLANGTERAHEPGERVSVEALEGMLEVAIALHAQVEMLGAQPVLAPTVERADAGR